MAETGPLRSEIVSRNVRAEIARSGMKHRDVAQEIGMLYPTLRNRISGRAEWRIDELDRLATLLGVPLARLLEEPRP